MGIVPRSGRDDPGANRSDRLERVTPRQSGSAPMRPSVSTGGCKAPFRRLSIEAARRRATVDDRMFHTRGGIWPEDGGAVAGDDAPVNRRTLRTMASHRRISVRGRDAGPSSAAP